jgi:glycerol-3-phosphate dehydrogenase
VEGLLGSYAFSDGQMDDYQLGLWVAQQARDAGASLREQQMVDAVDTAGNVHMGTTHIAHDYVINVAEP